MTPRIPDSFSDTFYQISLGLIDMVSSDTCAVELRVSLPPALAAEVEEVKRRDPEFLTRVLTYGMVRRMMFDHLRSRDEEAAGIAQS